MAGKTKDLFARFWAKATIGDGCWEWQRSFFASGYGAIWRNGANSYAHRVAYELAHGAVPGALNVCHRCDNRRCIRPDHLFLGTDADNSADKCRKGRQARGLSLPHTRLTEDDIASMRAAVESGSPQREVARRYNVHASHVSKVVNNKRRVAMEGGY